MLESSNDGNGAVLTTFRLPHVVAAKHVTVVGEFNDWSRTANPMDRDEQGFVAHIALKPGRSYRFRYLLDGERWENDWAADAYVTNEFGGDDSVIDLTDVPAAAAPQAIDPPALVPPTQVIADPPGGGPELPKLPVADLTDAATDLTDAATDLTDAPTDLTDAAAAGAASRQTDQAQEAVGAGRAKRSTRRTPKRPKAAGSE